MFIHILISKLIGRAEGEFRKDLAGHSTRSTMEERNDQNHLSAEWEYSKLLI